VKCIISVMSPEETVSFPPTLAQHGQDPWGEKVAESDPDADKSFEDDFKPEMEAKGELERLPDSDEYLAGLQAKYGTALLASIDAFLQA